MKMFGEKLIDPIKLIKKIDFVIFVANKHL